MSERRAPSSGGSSPTPVHKKTLSYGVRVGLTTEGRATQGTHH